jgi:hypothetical protein
MSKKISDFVVSLPLPDFAIMILVPLFYGLTIMAMAGVMKAVLTIIGGLFG